MILTNGYSHGGDIYRNDIRMDFSANVNPFGTPETVKAAVKAAAENMSVYPDPYCTHLRERLSQKYNVGTENIICGNGAAELIFQFTQAVMPKKALLPVPSFSEYENSLLSVGCNAEYLYLNRERDFALDAGILDLITENTDVVFLCNPNNPTGKSVNKELLFRIADKCRQTGTWLFLDECFFDLTDTDKAYSFIDELKQNDRIFILRAFTKTYGLAGVRLGFAICKNAELLERICRYSQNWNVSNLAQAAGIAALSCTDWAEKARNLFAEEKDYIMRELGNLNIKAIRGDANFCMIQGQPALYKKLLEKGILLRDCSNYAGLTEGDLRFCIRTHSENAELISRIKEVLYE